MEQKKYTIKQIQAYLLASDDLASALGDLKNIDNVLRDDDILTNTKK